MAVLLPLEATDVDNVTSHLWMSEWHTARFLQVWVVLCLSGVIRSDGSAVAAGIIGSRKISIPPPNIFFYISDTTGRDLVLQLEFAYAEDAVTLICSTLVGEERCRLTAQGVAKMPGRRTAGNRR